MHKTWAEAVGNFSDTMYGSTSEAFWNHVKNGGLFNKFDTCTHCDYSKQLTSSLQISFKSNLLLAKENIDQLFQKEKKSEDIGPCGSCKNGRVSTSYTPESKSTWYCLIEIDIMPYKQRNASKFPRG